MKDAGTMAEEIERRTAEREADHAARVEREAVDIIVARVRTFTSDGRAAVIAALQRDESEGDE